MKTDERGRKVGTVERALGEDPFSVLERKIEDRRAAVGVVGLGYVGLPLALAFYRAGFEVTGVDIDSNKINSLRGGRSYLTDVSRLEVQEAIGARRFKPTTDVECLAALDAITICVPTPLRKTKAPDLSYVMEATGEIAKRLRRGQLIVLESTTYPGTTEELVRPALEERGLRVGADFFLAYSPERLDPGSKRYSTRNIPKVVGGITGRCARLARLLYATCAQEVVTTSSTRVAEMAKLLENTFRSVNIALANELAMMCAHMGIDIWEVIGAAATKPFGFMPFYPGPGLGGHCIPVDPVYLAWKARLGGFELRLIEVADRINSGMPPVVANRAIQILNERGKSVEGSRVHVLGVTYKRDVNDTRESPAIAILELLAARGAILSYSDPYVPQLVLDGRQIDAVAPSPEALAVCDLAIIVTDHSHFDYAAIVKYAPFVLDTRNATSGLRAENVDRAFKALLVPGEGSTPVRTPSVA